MEVTEEKQIEASRVREKKFRAWHEGNKAFKYTTLKEIWMNGWLCCEGLESPKLPKDRQGVFTTREALENFYGFVLNADWEECIGLPSQDGSDIYVNDITADKCIIKIGIFTTGDDYSTKAFGAYKWDPEEGYSWGIDPDFPETIIGNTHEKPELLGL